MCAAMLLPLVEFSLPEEILRTWQRTKIQLIPHSDASVTVVITTAKDRLISLMTFLGREVENEEHIQMAKTCFESNDFQMTKDKNKSKSKRDPKIETASSLLSAKEVKSQQCIFCGANHDNLSCETARSMDLEKRIQAIKDKQGCFNCLKVGHSYKRCRNKIKCP